VDGVAQPLTVSAGFCGTASGTLLSITACPYLAASSNSPFFIGSNDGFEVFSGALDDVRVDGRALSAAELPDVMSPAGRLALDVVAWLRALALNLLACFRASWSGHARGELLRDSLVHGRKQQARLPPT
jgi:hypothetical protein